MINDKTLVTMDGRNVVFSVVQDRYVVIQMCPFFFNNHRVIGSVSTEKKLTRHVDSIYFIVLFQHKFGLM